MLILGILIGLVSGLLLAVLTPALWRKWTTKAADELKKPPPSP